MPSVELIDETLARLDKSLVGAGGAVGQGLRDASIVIVHRSRRQRYRDPCGVWLVDRRRAGHVEVNRHARWRAGLVADGDGRVLAELENRGRKVVAAVRDDCELARIGTRWRVATVELAGSTASWRLQWRRGPRDCAVFDGNVVVACGTAQPFEIRWRNNKEHTTAVWFHHGLNIDQRAIALLALLARLGPPDPPPG